jgi:hypothetical protein
MLLFDIFKGQAVYRGHLTELLRQVLDFDHVHWRLLIPPAPARFFGGGKTQRGPDGYRDEDNGRNNPENEGGHRERPGLRTDFGENDNTYEDDCNGQPQGDSYG